MTNRTRFRVCRGCLMSSAAADLIDMFEESGEILKKFQEISKIDISKDENKNFALICRECLVKVETGFEIARTLRNTEKYYFSKLRGKTEGEIEESEEEETGILSENEELEKNETLTSILDVLNEEDDKYLEEGYEDLVQGGVTDMNVGDCHQVQNQKSYEGSSSSDHEILCVESAVKVTELPLTFETPKITRRPQSARKKVTKRFRYFGSPEERVSTALKILLSNYKEKPISLDLEEIAPSKTQKRWRFQCGVDKCETKIIVCFVKNSRVKLDNFKYHLKRAHSKLGEMEVDEEVPTPASISTPSNKSQSPDVQFTVEERSSCTLNQRIDEAQSEDEDILYEDEV